VKREPIDLSFLRPLVVDLFAGGGGVSEGFVIATGQEPDVAINHNANALSMHQANHPYTRHFTADVREVCPYLVTQGHPVGALHLSPDCTEHSQAKGGQPRDVAVRSLSWTGYRWAAQVRPAMISLENVIQLLKWGPLIAKRCPETGRVVTLDMIPDAATGKKTFRVAAPGERVPVQNQYLIPDPKQAGRTWRKFIAMLRGLGYELDYWELNAVDYGAGTGRKRLYMVARCDGLPIVKPTPTHARRPTKAQQPISTAADHIDFSIPSYSIFLSPQEAKEAGVRRPLADATLRRIATGVFKYVLDCADPFIVPVQNASNGDMAHSIREPIRTITATPKGGGYALAIPSLVQLAHGQGKPGGVQRWGDGSRDLREAMNTITASGGGGLALATAFLAQMNGGYNTVAGRDMREPVSAITTTGSQQQLVTANLITLRRNCVGQGMDEPLAAITAGAEHHALMECTLSPEHEEGALRVAAFLMRYYSTGGQWADLREPLHTMTTKDRIALVTVYIKGTPLVLVDIKIRMLVPRELYNAQSFPPDYIIDRGHDGRRFTKAQQVHMVGNSVPPLLHAAVLRANLPPELLARPRAVSRRRAVA